MEKTHNIPTWRVTLYCPLYNGLASLMNPVTRVVVEAYTGPSAEEAALANHPGWKVTRCVRLTGFDGRAA